MKFFKLPDALNKRGIASKWKKFTSGFTLVELVVVIAILAILSGIGVLGYNGYIEYAQRAADEELIAAVNTAFAAACEENGVDRTTLKNNSAALNILRDTKCFIKGLSRVTGAKDLASIQKDFDGYFAGNENTPLKYYNWIEYVAGEGFKGDIKLVGQSGGRTVAVSEGQANTFSGSGLDEVGADNLLNEVDKVVQIFAMLSGGSGNGEELYSMLTSDPAFLEFASEKMGGVLSAEELKQLMNGELDVSSLTAEQQEAAKTLQNDTSAANLMVLYAASKSNGLLENADFKNELIALGDTIEGVEPGPDLNLNAMLPLLGLMQTEEEDMGRGVAKAAFGYGLLFSFKEYQNDHPGATWTEYLNSKDAEKDMAAYASCMDMINDNTTSVDSTSAVLQGGFNDADFVAALMAALKG